MSMAPTVLFTSHYPLWGALYWNMKSHTKKGGWSDHAISAWNLGISMEHHRSLNVYRKDKRAERIVNTLLFKHKYLTSPIVTPEDAVVESAKKLTYAVTAKSKSTESEQVEYKKNWQKCLRKL